MSLSLRARAEAGDRLLGVLLRMPSEELVEMAAVAGFDYVLIDCEHGPADVIALRQHIAVAAIHDVPVIVRVGEDDAGMILRALDQGAQGILVPHIDSAADAAAAVAAAHYPPAGRRGFATYSRAGRFGETDAATHRDWFLANTLVLGMIESPVGVAAATDIVATSGLDGIMIGPADLAATSGPGDQPLAAATAQVNAAIAAAGVLRMDIVGTAAAATAAFDDGAQLVVYNLAASLMGHLRGLIEPRG
ncbi:HpcH/HpaI aldolase/citrate lyase family protein [Microbacterium sp. P01]|uniref:HpcH/HpaI aldolase family protein n=1 Tax=Microbacterium sp. P01 TaxID=3366261 RepID=UPI00366A9A14